MCTLILLVILSFTLVGWAVVDYHGTHFGRIEKDNAESSIKCSEVDYEIFKTSKIFN